jgi:hypothetical protein
MRLIARLVPMDRTTGPRRHHHVAYPVSLHQKLTTSTLYARQPGTQGGILRRARSGQVSELRDSLG